jgi:DNA-directed RNA polymerase specialized sigma24 family protein
LPEDTRPFGPALDRMFYAMAKDYVSDRSLWDDCVQEARIHVWKLRQRGVPRTEAYYNKAARNRIINMGSRQTWLGHSGHHGYPVDPLRRPHDSLDLMYETAMQREAM